MTKKRKPLHKTTVTEFMTGRYGYDQLSKFLMILGMILLVATMLLQNHIYSNARYVYLLAIIVLGFGYFRMGSRKIEKRKKENEAYLRFMSKYSGKARAALEKDEKYRKYATFEVAQELGEDGESVIYVYTCRNCGHEQRFPENMGIIKVICPHCGKELVDRT